MQKRGLSEVLSSPVISTTVYSSVGTRPSGADFLGFSGSLDPSASDMSLTELPSPAQEDQILDRKLRSWQQASKLNLQASYSILSQVF